MRPFVQRISQFFCLAVAATGLGSTVAVAQSDSATSGGLDVKVRKQVRNGATEIYVNNRSLAPVSIEFKMTRAVNARTDKPWPALFLVPARSEILAGVVRRNDERQASSFNYSYRWMLGDPTAQPDPLASYVLPFAGAVSRISQAYGGLLTTHTHSSSLYAVDFPLPVGTPILAARAGLVVEVKDGFDEGAPQPEYRSRANLVRVLHDDGSWAEYVHLVKGGILVKLGDRVEAGQRLGLSGNSGFSSGPHLHFGVARNIGGESVSMPVDFTLNGKRIKPQPGMTIAA